MCLRFNLGACMLSCVQLCDPMDCSQPGSSDHGISQAKVLEWVGSSYSRGLLFPTQGSTPHLLGLLLWQADSWPLCYVGSPGNVVSLVNYEPSPRMPLRSSSMFYSSCSWTHLLWGTPQCAWWDILFTKVFLHDNSPQHNTLPSRSFLLRKGCLPSSLALCKCHFQE